MYIDFVIGHLSQFYDHRCWEAGAGGTVQGKLQPPSKLKSSLGLLELVTKLMIKEKEQVRVFCENFYGIIFH